MWETATHNIRRVIVISRLTNSDATARLLSSNQVQWAIGKTYTKALQHKARAAIECCASERHDARGATLD